jgi:hypothetical protein
MNVFVDEIRRVFSWEKVEGLFTLEKGLQTLEKNGKIF